MDYVVGVEPANPMRGKEAIFYVRRQNPITGGRYSEEFHQEEDHLIPTREMPWEEVNLRFEELKKNPEFEGIEFKKRAYSKRKGVIHAICSKEDNKLLPYYFLESSPSQILRWRYPTFSRVKIKDGKITHSWREGFASLEDIVNDKKVAIDIEWDQKNEVYMAIFYTGEGFGNYLLSTVLIGKRMVGDASVIRCKNQEGLVKRLGDLVGSYDPLWIIGHYIGGDKRRLRDEPEEELYHPGVGGRRDVVRSVQRTYKQDEQGNPITQVKKMVTKGRLTFDTLPYLIHYQNYTKNNRLPAHTQNIGLDFEKSLNHIEMWILVDGARKGDRKAAQALAEYTVNDGKAEFALGKYYLETLARKSMLFRRDPDSMCATKRTTNADDRWKRRYFFKMHTFRDRYQVRAMKAAQQREEEFEFIPELKYDKYSLLIFPRDETGRFITQDGFFDGISTVYIIPYVSALGLLINQFPDAMDFLRKMKREKDPRLKFDMAKTLNAYINQPMIELERAITRAGFNLGDCVNSPHDIPQDMDVIDWAFGQEYRLDYIGGERNTNFMTLNNNLFFWKIRANQLLKNAELINYSENFLFLRNVDVGELEQQGIAVDMGSGPVISQKDFVIANASGKYIYSGIGITRRIRYDFGRDLIFDFIEGALNLKSEEELYAMLKGGIEKLESGGVPKTRLVYKSMDREHGRCMTEKGHTELGYAEFIWTDNLPPDYQFYRSQFLKFTDLFQLVMPTYHPFAIDLLHGKRNLFT